MLNLTSCTSFTYLEVEVMSLLILYTEIQQLQCTVADTAQSDQFRSLRESFDNIETSNISSISSSIPTSYCM